MNPTEPNNPSGGAPPATEKPAEAPETASALNGLEDALAAARQAAGISTAAPTSETPQEAVKSPIDDQFTKQFGDPVGSVQPPAAESPAPVSTITDPILTDSKSPIAEIPEIKPENSADTTVQPEDSNLAAEATSKPEQTRHEKVMQQIEDILEKYNLTEKKPEEVTV